MWKPRSITVYSTDRIFQVNTDGCADYDDGFDGGEDEIDCDD